MTTNAFTRGFLLRTVAVAAFLLLALNALPSFAYNWSWDQGHDCVQGQDGWGKWGYDGNFKGSEPTKECCQQNCTVCPVYANTGRYQKTWTDLRVPGVGPALTITRTYNSQEWSSGLLGYGWTFNFGKKVIIARNRDGEKIIGVQLRTGEKNYYREGLDGSLTRLTEYGATYDLIKSSDTAYTIRHHDGTWYELRDDGKIDRIIDKNRNELVFSYSAAGCLERITNASGNTVDIQLGVNGKIASISDNLGRTVTYGYDLNGNLTGVTDPLGNTLRYEYDTNNYLVRIIDARGNPVESVTYDNHQPARVATILEKGENYTIGYYDGYTRKSDSRGNTWTYYYNDVGVIERFIDPFGNEKKQQPNKITATSVDWEEDYNGNRTTYTYDSDGNVLSKTDALGNTWTHTYAPGSRLKSSTTSPRGTQTTYTYNTSGNRTSVTRDAGGPLAATTSFVYDTAGNMTREIDPLGNITRYEYNTSGNLLKLTDPTGNTITYTYDDFGNRLSTTDPNGNTTSFTYDLNGKLLTMTDALGNTTHYAWDANGNRTAATDPEGHTTTLEYDAFNRLIRQSDPVGNTTAFTYDHNDKITSITDIRGNTTTSTYDVLGRLTAQADAMGQVTSFTYDSNGNLLSRIDANGNTTSYTYDAMNRQISVTDALSGTILYTYDAEGNLLTVTDARGNITTFSYDAHGRLVKETRPMGQETLYQYDLAGNLVDKTDAEDQITRYTYDAGANLATIDYFAADNATTPESTITLTYDNAGRLTGYDDGVTSAQNTYDPTNKKLSETIHYGTFSLAYSYEWYADGTKKSLTMPDGTRYTYTYQANNQLTGVDIPGQGTISYNAYDGYRPSRITLPGNTTTVYSYDPMMRITGITVKDPAQTILMNYQYAYDTVHNITGKVTEHGTYTHGYSKLYQLTESNSPVYDAETFAYDPAGNRLTAADTSGTWSYNQNNELLGYDGTTYLHDNNGSMIRETGTSGTTTYTYNAAGRLTRAATSDQGVIGSYYYDPFGRRLWKEANGTRTYFLYTDEGLAGEYTAAGIALKTYGYKPGSTWT
ncbi:MAG: DUF6531 domain-containing protein, partial [Pseudomonadota bacterium]